MSSAVDNAFIFHGVVSDSNPAGRTPVTHSRRNWYLAEKKMQGLMLVTSHFKCQQVNQNIGLCVCVTQKSHVYLFV